MGWIRAAAGRVAMFLAWAIVLAALAIGFGIDSEDVRALREFCDGVERWQRGPEFRRVGYEYVTLSHTAMNATPWGVPATSLIMGIRSIPGLGPEYAVSDTSQAHYDNFTRGELSAYLHLCGEQTMDWVIRELHAIATRGASDDDVRRFLQSWKMNRPVADDAIAIAGVKRLIMEIDAADPLPSRTHVEPELEAAAAGLASRLGLSPDDQRLTREQQREVFQKLDDDIRQRDAQLWRYKQISDLCSGIWAQTFGQDYTMVIRPVIAARQVGRIAGPVGLVGLMLLRWRRRKAREGARDSQLPEPAIGAAV
jgi:hypothetical protein